MLVLCRTRGGTRDRRVRWILCGPTGLHALEVGSSHILLPLGVWVFYLGIGLWSFYFSISTLYILKVNSVFCGLVANPQLTCHEVLCTVLRDPVVLEAVSNWTQNPPEQHIHVSTAWNSCRQCMRVPATWILCRPLTPTPSTSLHTLVLQIHTPSLVYPSTERPMTQS